MFVSMFIRKDHRMLVKEVFLLFIGFTYGYNIDEDFPIIYSRESTLQDSGSYFGYTVHLYRKPGEDISWLIVGAPKGNYSSSKKLPYPSEPGVAYRCTIRRTKCEEIRPLRIDDEEDYIEQIGRNMTIHKRRGWFGSAISIDELHGIVTICAPRIIITIYQDYYIDTMQGMCYNEKVSSNTLLMEDRDLAFHDFTSNFWYNPMHGFSVHYARTKGNGQKDVSRIVGEPKHETYGTVDILYSNTRMTVELPSSDDLSQFGFSVESGYFFKRDQLLFASGAPGWNYVGMVGIINPAIKKVVTKLHGTSIGEYFGASLAVGDLNNDGLDDLLIGAPYWGEDNGKLYAYLGTAKEHFKTVITIQGVVEESHFGYAIASSDLDNDGFDDVIVGSPWEDNGVIYIFNGGPDLENTNLQVSQRIEAVGLLKEMRRFGFSISKPVDIDGNGYLDIAIGAYKSEHAVILRGKPVVKTELIIQTVPSTLQRNATQFLVKICPKYTGYNRLRIGQRFKITVTVDERYQRTTETILELKSVNSLRSLITENCLSAQVNISRNIRDFIEPIAIFAKHDFMQDNVSSLFCEYCPVERRNNKLQTAQTLLSFNIDCGADKVCNSNISATGKFYNVRENDMWVIGSDDMSLEINLKNHGEPAYLTMLEFAIPEGIVLRSILPACQEDTSEENLRVICEVGNPIWKDEEKDIKLDLDMRHLINGSLYNNKIDFDVKIKTRSINRGMISIVKTLSLVNEVSLSLQGKANEEAYYLSTLNEAAPNITFQHAYQVYKLGASPIGDARLIIKVPLALKGSETFVHIYNPQFYMSGERYDCFSENTLSENSAHGTQNEFSLNEIDMSTFNNKTRRYVLGKRDLQESYLWFHDMKNIEDLQIANESRSNNVIDMNCSIPDANCTTITCNLNALRTLQDTGKMVIKFVLDVNKLKENFKNNGTVLRFSTAASVDIRKPETRLDINGTRSTIEVATMFYDIPKVEKLQLWIVILSVLVGLLLLLIFAVILKMMGFFKRRRKQELTDSKSNEVTGETDIKCADT